MKTILILGCGQVGGNVIKGLESIKDINIYCFARSKRQNYDNVTFINSYKDIPNPDIVVEALPGKTNIDVEFAYVILKRHVYDGIDIVTCNKMLMQRSGYELCEMAKVYGGRIMLSSLMATDELVDHNNFTNYTPEQLYKFRGADGKKTAEYVVKDIKKLLEEK